jgi:hypothetical protein
VPRYGLQEARVSHGAALVALPHPTSARYGGKGADETDDAP